MKTPLEELEPSYEDIQRTIDRKRKTLGITVDPNNYCLGQKIYEAIIHQMAKKRQFDMDDSMVNRNSGQI